MAGLRPKTVVLYRYLLRKHIGPALGKVAIADLHSGQVRAWRRQLLDGGVSEVSTTKAYHLLMAVLNTAVDDGVIRRNLCRIKAAGRRAPARSTSWSTMPPAGWPTPSPPPAPTGSAGRSSPSPPRLRCRRADHRERDHASMTRLIATRRLEGSFRRGQPARAQTGSSVGWSGVIAVGRG